MLQSVKLQVTIRYKKGFEIVKVHFVTRSTQVGKYTGHTFVHHTFRMIGEIPIGALIF